MAIPYASSIDLMGNELQNARVQNLASPPAHAAGRIFFNTATGLFGISDGTTWKYVEVGALDIEAVQDAVAAMVAASTVVTASYNDSTGAITLSIGAGQVTNTMLASGISADKISDGSTNAVFTLVNRTKLNGIATSATANDTDANLKNRANHTGTQTADTITDGTTNKAFLATERTKLAGIATGATANSSDATLLARANHTGTQAAATISDFNSAVDARVATIVGDAPAALNTLGELSDALGDDPNFAATITALINTRAKTFSQDVGDNSATVIVVTHNLNTRDVLVGLRATGAPYNEVVVENEATTVNTVTLRFGTAPTLAQFRVTIHGR